jgi:hypothetical protein
MIQVELKAKHYFLIVDILFGTAAYVSFSTIEKIKTACQELQDNDAATVEIDVPTFINVFSILAQKPEGSYNNVNTEMMDMLTPQIQAGVANGDAEWISLGQQVTTIRANNLQVVTDSIAISKNRLYNIPLPTPPVDDTYDINDKG